MPRSLTINPEHFSASAWHELYYATVQFPDEEPKVAGLELEEDQDGAVDATPEQIDAVIRCCEEKMDAIARGEGDAESDLEREMWTNDLEEAVSVLRGYLGRAAYAA